MIYKPSWVFAHAGDDLAVLMTKGWYARVWYNGTTYTYQVMNKHAFSEYCLGRIPKMQAEGTAPTHGQARLKCEAVVFA